MTQPADISTGKVKAGDPHGYGRPSSDDEGGEDLRHPLESEDAQRLLARLKGWLTRERDKQRDNRVQMATDEEYYDGYQWTEEEKAILAERGQQPSTINDVMPAVDWIVGTERRMRVDWKVLPRGPEDTKGSMALTKLAKFVSDVNKAAFVRSRAFEQAVKVGIGWLEIGAKNDWEDDPIYMRWEDWRNCWYDSHAREVDFSDARYFFRKRIVDLDIALKMFPERAEALRGRAYDIDNAPDFDDEEEGLSQGYHAPFDHNATNERRQVVSLIEAWYREPETVPVLRGGRYSGRRYDPNNPFHQKVVDDGMSSLFDSVQMVVKFAVFVDYGDLLYSSNSPYTHNRFPFVPVIAKRRGRDGLVYGVIRNMRDPQDSRNKRRSKMLWMLSVNRVITDEGAVEDLDDLREEASRPDAVIEKKKGYELKIENNLQLAAAHIEMEDRDAAYIRQASGVTGENLGLQTNATSGRAILARQEQGNVVLTALFDNLRLAYQLSGEILLSLIGQFYTDERIIRIGVDNKTPNGEPEFLEINRWDPDNGIFNNDITDTMADFVVSEQDFRDTTRQAMFESLMDVVSKLPPEMSVRVLKIALTLSDIPEKEAILHELEAMIPPADQPPPPDPVAEAQAGKIRAETTLTQAKALREKLSSVAEAITSSKELALNPALSRLADELMRDIDQITGGGTPAAPAQPAQPPIPMPQDAA